MVTLSIVEQIFKNFSLLESWLNFLQHTCDIFHYTFKMLPLYLAKYEMWQNDKLIIRYSLFYLKIGQIICKDVYISSIVLDKIPRGVVSIDQCCCWWNFTCDANLKSWQDERHCLRLSSITALMNGNNILSLLSRTTELILNIFSSNLTNFTFWLIFKV